MHRGVSRILILVSVIALVSCSGKVAPPTSAIATLAPMTSTPTSASRFTFEFNNLDSLGRAVAFHSIEFIDAQAHTIQIITFGGQPAVTPPGSGWLENGRTPEVGTFQWTGGTEKEASLDLQIPAGTQGLLLQTMTDQAEVWMDVSVDGKKLATVRVSNQWAKGYVPLVEPTPLANSNLEPQWTDGHFFPRFPSTQRLYVIRLRSALENWNGAPSDVSWRVNQDYDSMMALTLVGMQGLINRHGPQVYLDWEDEGNYGNAARYWVTPLSKDVEIVNLDLDGLSAFRFLYSRYSAYFQGAVIYDPEIPDTINLATTLAGLEDRIILAPEQLKLPDVPAFNSTTDLRTLEVQNGWDNTVQGRTNQYLWLYKNLWPKVEKRILGVVSPGPPVGGPPDPTQAGKSFPLCLAARDYLVALRLAAIYLSPTESPQKELFDKFMQDTSQPISIYSFYSNQEVDLTAYASRHGDTVSSFTNPNSPISSGNWSVFSGIPEQVGKYSPKIKDDDLFAALGNRPIMTILDSDGDALQVLADRGFWGGAPFHWDTAKIHPYGQTINPTVAELAPTIWNHYLDPEAPAGWWWAYQAPGTLIHP